MEKKYILYFFILLGLFIIFPKFFGSLLIIYFCYFIIAKIIIAPFQKIASELNKISKVKKNIKKFPDYFTDDINEKENQKKIEKIIKSFSPQSNSVRTKILSIARNCHYKNKTGRYIDEKGYERFSDSDTPVHRYVASKKIGRPIRSYEVVHHIDGNKRNNNPQNLLVCTQDEHDRIHRRNLSATGSWYGLPEY